MFFWEGPLESTTQGLCLGSKMQRCQVRPCNSRRHRPPKVTLGIAHNARIKLGLAHTLHVLTAPGSCLPSQLWGSNPVQQLLPARCLGGSEYQGLSAGLRHVCVLPSSFLCSSNYPPAGEGTESCLVYASESHVKKWCRILPVRIICTSV